MGWQDRLDRLITPRRCGAAALSLVLVFLSLWFWQRSRFVTPQQSAIVLDRHGVFMAQIGGGPAGYGYWPVSTVPPRVEAALLALEDRRFWQHPGIDPVAVLRAAMGNLAAAHRISGASTLAMQVARMQHPAARGYLAKAIEAVTAVTMTLRYGHQAILQQYLRLVPFGQSSHGIAHAARWYFDKPVEDLSWAEIAFLSAIPQSPTAMNPGTESGRLRAIARGRLALLRLYDQGVLDQAALAQAQIDIGQLTIPHHAERSAEALHAILRLDHAVTAARAGDTPDLELIRSTLDLGLQHQVTRLARARLDVLRLQGAQQMAVMVVDPRDMQVLALVGSGGYAAPNAGKIDYARRSRSPGSTLKPFIFAEALEQGDIGPATILSDDPDSGTGIENADRRFLGPLLPRQALGNSRNVPAARLIRLTGLDRMHWFLGQLGLHDDDHPADRYGLTLSIGGMPTTLDRLVTAYGVLANGGQAQPLRWYQQQAVIPARRLLSAETAAEITLFLADPMARLPSFQRMGATEYPFPAAVKTGTSQGYRDAWVVAYTDHYLIGVWLGRPDGQPMAGLSGASSAALLAHDVLMALQAPESDGFNDTMFRPPAHHHPVPLCARTGQLADSHCDTILTEYLPTSPGATIPVSAPAAGMIPSPPHRRIRIVSPLNHSEFIQNPESPPGSVYLPLRLSADSTPGQVLWYVDGQAFQLADTGDSVSWPVLPGRHIVEARSPFGEIIAAPISVLIR